MTSTTRTIKKPKNVETFAWKWMRYTGVLMLPLVWGHVLIQDIVIGVHGIDNNYVIQRLSNVFWQAYDILLLGFTFAHGMNGLRQVLDDFIHSSKTRKLVSWGLFAVWIIVTIIGAIALIRVGQDKLAALG
jgi:succinate dehydrogenase / fumarate reductase membrane anchor subunit